MRHGKRGHSSYNLSNIHWYALQHNSHRHLRFHWDAQHLHLGLSFVIFFITFFFQFFSTLFSNVHLHFQHILSSFDFCFKILNDAIDKSEIHCIFFQTFNIYIYIYIYPGSFKKVQSPTIYIHIV